jgi:GTP cyclohydrolase I
VSSSISRPDDALVGRLARPTRRRPRQAIRTILAYVRDDPAREGLVRTPDRVVRAFDEHFAGYAQDPIGNPAAHLRGGRRL